MSSSTQNNAVTIWVLGGIIIVALLLMASGGALIMADSDETDDANFEETSSVIVAQSYPKSTYTPVSEAGPIMLEPSTPVDWTEYMPTPSNVNAYTAVELFGSMAMGSDAPVVTILEYGAYGCVSCRKVHNDRTIQDLLENYGTQIRYVFVVWPVQHTNDPLATEASLCAMDQGEEVYWAYHNALLDLSQAEFNAYNNSSRFASLAEHVQMKIDIEMDIETFEMCLLEGDYREFVYDLVDMGWRINLRGTPTFFINGQMTSSMYVTHIVDEILGIPEEPEAE